MEFLDLEGIHRLDGIERWPQLRNLKLGGTFRTLEPLTALAHLTHLHLATDEPLDLAPLCRLPELRSLKITSLQPYEFFVLTDAPRLHEVEAQSCEANTREVSALQEVLKPWDEEFLAPAPRPLRPLRFASEDWQKTRNRNRWGVGCNVENWAGNKGMNDSEEHWLARRLQAALNKAMGGPDWGEISSSWVRVHTTDAADRLPEFVEIIRRVLAECRYPHALMLHIDLQAAWHDEDAGSWKDPEQAELERERAEEEEWRARNREEAELREREHRLRQLRQEGAKIDPKEFEPAPAPPNIETGGDEPGLFEEDEPHPQAEQYDLFGEINEEGLFVTNHTVDVGERLMGREAEKL